MNRSSVRNNGLRSLTVIAVISRYGEDWKQTTNLGFPHISAVRVWRPLPACSGGQIKSAFVTSIINETLCCPSQREVQMAAYTPTVRKSVWLQQV